MLSSAWQSTVGAVLMITIVGGTLPLIAHKLFSTVSHSAASTAGFSGSCVFLTIDTYSVIQTPKVTMLVVLFPLLVVLALVSLDGSLIITNTDTCSRSPAQWQYTLCFDNP